MPTPGASQPKPWAGARPQAGVLAALFLATFALHAFSPVITSTDSAWTFHVSASILREGNIDLDEYRPLVDLQLDYRIREIKSHLYSYYPIATPVLVLPVVWAVNLIYPLSHPTDFYAYLLSHAPDDRTARLEKLVASLLVALATAVMFLVARQRLGIVRSSALATIFAFATSMWSTASRALWQHGPSALCLALALYLILVASHKPLAVFGIGLILGSSYLVRPTNSLSLVLLGLYFLLNQRRLFWLYAAGALLVLIPFQAQNWLIYGNLLPPYSYQLFERIGSPAAILEGLAGTLLSPNRGLFIFTPLFAFSVYGMYLALTKGAAKLSSIEPYLIAIVMSHWITTSVFEDWGGAWSIGPRYFVDMIPFLVYFLIPVFESILQLKPLTRYAFAASIVVSTLIQLHCATSIDPFMWNGKPQALVEAPNRKWDWGDLQFLRGFCAGDEVEGRAPACWFERGS